MVSLSGSNNHDQTSPAPPCRPDGRKQDQSIEFERGIIRNMVTQARPKPRLRITLPRKKLTEFCKRWKISELAVFGSVLREDFRPTSDIDLLVSFKPEAKISLFDLVRIQGELKEILGRDVDVVERKSIEKSENYIRRRNILESAKVIYAA